MLTTLRDLLSLPAFAGVEVVGGGLPDAPVTWVHVSEVPDGAKYLTGGELLLSTGGMLAGMTAGERARYVRSLSAGGASGLMLELVRHFTEVPAEMVEAAADLGFPLLCAQREVSFAALTRAAHARILAPAPQTAQASLGPLLDALHETGRAADFVSAHLGPLLALPPRPQEALLGTLDALLAANFSVAQAARTLGVRRQTVYYRLEQLTAMLGDVQDARRGLGLRLALELRREGSMGEG